MFSISIYHLSKMISIFKVFLSVLLTVLIALLQFKSSNSVALLQSTRNFHFIPPPVTIFLINKLSGSRSLGVHCKDKNHDLGFRIIGPGKTGYFTLQPNTYAVIVDYWCLFKWVGDSHNHYYDVYVQERDEQACKKKCVYEIHESGPCKPFLNRPPQCFPWNSKAVIAERQFGEENNTLNV